MFLMFIIIVFIKKRPWQSTTKKNNLKFNLVDKMTIYLKKKSAQGELSLLGVQKN
jgi:hypothetical protein